MRQLCFSLIVSVLSNRRNPLVYLYDLALTSHALILRLTLYLNRFYRQRHDAVADDDVNDNRNRYL